MSELHESHLKVFVNRSELVLSDGTIQEFLEGGMSQQARERYATIEAELKNDYLAKQIEFCRDNSSSIDFSQLDQEHKQLLDKLADSVTSGYGRGIGAITILQLCIKAIEPNQSIRLHKGSPRANASSKLKNKNHGKATSSNTNFSWQEGISMRTLDNKYNTPTLRKYDLIKLNKDGFMMTRSLAENYPYSSLYKAEIKGARREWIKIVEGVEIGEIQPQLALHYFLSQLINRAYTFKKLAEEVLQSLKALLSRRAERLNRNYIYNLLVIHRSKSDYPARLMEISMHSLIQAICEYDIFPEWILQPLSQMRSANKKHGNIADIEVLQGDQIIEAWDAKYGKSYLRDEIEELADKLEGHLNVITAGFVTSATPERLDEIAFRCEEIEEEFGISLQILTFERWVDNQFNRALDQQTVTEQDLASAWLTAYTESLAQQRREFAPIDEPCYQWLTTLKEVLSETELD